MEQVGLVLNAGGARGAYQAGALAVLLPELAARGERPTVFTGASVGALNAAILAASAHLPVELQVDQLLQQTAAATKPNVFRPLWQQLPLVALRYGAETLAVRLTRLQGLLGTEPLARTLDRAIDWERLRRNVADGTVRSLTTVATEVRSGRVVAFVETAAAHLPSADTIDYVAARIGVDHLLGSAAIPMLFPPARVTAPRTAAGWYLDGSTRLHTPVKPALDLGAARVAVIGTTGIAPRPLPTREPRHDGGGPAADPGTVDLADVDLGDGAVTLLNAMIEDSLRRDLRHLSEVNALLADPATRSAAERWREAIGAPAYRRVPYLVVAPQDPHEIGRLALEVYRRNHHGLRGLRDPDFQVLHRLLGSDSPLQGELMSFVMFDRDFLDELVRLGRRDARRWIAEQGGLWRTGPLPPAGRAGLDGQEEAGRR